VSLVAIGAAMAPRWADAAGKVPKTLTTVRESSFIKAFDDFFVKTLAPEYEKLTGIKVGHEAVSVGGMLTHRDGRDEIWARDRSYRSHLSASIRQRPR
jgi:hypothetical protein